MSHKIAKTSGLEFITLSLMSFNGSGYADMNDPDSYIDSYIAYKQMKKLHDQANSAVYYREELLPTISNLLEKTTGASHQPSDKNIIKFSKFYKPAKNWIQQNNLTLF